MFACKGQNVSQMQCIVTDRPMERLIGVVTKKMRTHEFVVRCLVTAVYILSPQKYRIEFGWLYPAVGS